MSCRHDLEKLSAYKDDEFDARQRIEVERQLRSCEPCREFLATLERISGALVLPPVTDSGFLSRLNARRDEDHRVLTTWRKVAFALMPAAALVLFVAGVVIGKSIVVDEETAFAELEAIELGDSSEIELPARLAGSDRVLYIALGGAPQFVEETNGTLVETEPLSPDATEPRVR